MGRVYRRSDEEFEDDGTWTEGDYELAKKYADSLERFLTEINKTMILAGVSKEKEKEAIKAVKKLVKNLRKGKLDKVYDPVAYEEYRRLSEGEY